ncbi:MAG: MFS transporter [Deltaproteobacteria bacterium]|nr:MFS transporter [Deltaproteobacteria bacterium]
MKGNGTISYPKFRWLVMVTMIIGVVAQGVIMIAPAPLIGEVARYLNRELGLVTFTVMGLWTVTVCIGGIIGGAVVDRLGIVKVYLVCGVLLILSTVLIPVVGPNLPLIIVLRLVGGLGTGPILTTISRLAAEWFPLKERGLITGVQGMSVALGVFVGFGVAPAVFEVTRSWPLTMAWMALPAIVFLCFTIAMILGPKAPELINEEKEDPLAGERDFKLALKEPSIYLCVVYVFLFNWLIQGINDLTPGYFAVSPPIGIGWGPVTAGKLMMIFQLVFMIGSLISGWLHDQVYRGNTRLQVMVAFVLTGVYFFVKFSGVIGRGPNPLLLTIMMVTAFFMGQGIATIMAFIARNYPEHITGKVGGMSMGLGLIGGVIGIGCGSLALTRTQTYEVSILIVTVVAIIGFFVAMALKRPKAFAHLHKD